MESTLMLAVMAMGGVLLAWAAATTRVFARLRPARRSGALRRLEGRLEAADIPLSGREFLLTGLGAGTLLALILWVLLGPNVLTVVALFLGPVVYWQYWTGRQERFRRAYMEALDQSIEILLRSYRANPNLHGALEEAAPYMPDPVRADFMQVVAALGTGTSITEAIYRVAERRRNPYFDMLAEALAMREQQGGRLGEVLAGLRTLMQGILRIQNEVRAKQTQPKLEGTIVAVAPFAFLLLMKMVVPEYEGGFYRTLEGQLVLILAVILSGVAYLLSQKIAKAGLDLEPRGSDPEVLL